MEVTRSEAVCENAAMTTREQFNGITAFVDASNVYGSEDETAIKLRDTYINETFSFYLFSSIHFFWYWCYCISDRINDNLSERYYYSVGHSLAGCWRPVRAASYCLNSKGSMGQSLLEGMWGPERIQGFQHCTQYLYGSTTGLHQLSVPLQLSGLMKNYTRLPAGANTTTMRQITKKKHLISLGY